MPLVLVHKRLPQLAPELLIFLPQELKRWSVVAKSCCEWFATAELTAEGLKCRWAAGGKRNAVLQGAAKKLPASL